MQTQNVSKHCRNERMQQRGVPNLIINLIRKYGECHRRRGHPSSWYFSRKSIAKMHKDGIEKRFIIEAESRPNMRFVVDPVSETFITVLHADKNKQRVRYEKNAS